MLQKAWQLAVAATDWAALHQRRQRMTDAELAHELGGTAVAQAAALCYGPFSEQQMPKSSRCAVLMLCSMLLIEKCCPSFYCID